MANFIWEINNGALPEGYVVHHKDGDKLNDDISNLELMEWGEHTSHHSLELIIERHNNGRIKTRKRA